MDAINYSTVYAFLELKFIFNLIDIFPNKILDSKCSLKNNHTFDTQMSLGRTKKTTAKNDDIADGKAQTKVRKKVQSLDHEN